MFGVVVGVVGTLLELMVHKHTISTQHKSLTFPSLPPTLPQLPAPFTTSPPHQVGQRHSLNELIGSGTPPLPPQPLVPSS